jgi:hypothetical protein
MPQIPVLATWSSAGLCATSSGVFQPSSFIGLSAIPSMMIRIAFNLNSRHSQIATVYSFLNGYG